MSGLIHVYIGDGKGKTTASVGLSVRAAGRDKKVIFAQFLKSGITGELRSLETLGIPVIRSAIPLGFTCQMDAAAQAACKAEQQRIWNQVLAVVQAGPVDLLVLDEVLDAINTKMLDEQELRSFVEHKPTELELVLTGRGPGEWLMEQADYISEVRKVKHPFTRGIPARIGIEK
ncbi:MAG: cob(I)yrinic acid a,c-diamide adenosyltransferase [Treponema sp.]|jgi:cob(I)alamin adenosyltransferase|nr:cob(I)yrinic acid a,c-diamide adenosyltransferase [Treponema sp.]